MKATSAILAALLYFTPGSALGEGETNSVSKKPHLDQITFRNGDILHGSLGAISKEEGVRWERMDGVRPFQFDPNFVTELQLGRSGGNPNWTNNCAVQLANGDELHGRLLSFDGAAVSLDTWYAGTLSLPKESIAMLLPMTSAQKVVFEGPTGLEGWTMGKVNAAAIVESGDWHYQNGALYAVKSASIAREVNLPDVASLQFDLEWRGFFHVAIALYTEYLHPINLVNKETEPKFGGFYSMQINPFSANLLPVKQFEPLRYLGQAPMQSLSQKTSARIDIRINKEKKTIALLVDGTLVKQWVDTDPGEFAGSGGAIRFVHQGQGAVKISNIKVTEWDGLFEEPPSLTPNKSQDLARLRNGDRIVGPVKAIQGDRLSIEAAGTQLEIPLERVKQIELAAGKAFAPQKNANTVQGHFQHSGIMTFDLEKWTPEGGFIARTEKFGTVTLQPNTFTRLVFDLDGRSTSN